MNNLVKTMLLQQGGQIRRTVAVSVGGYTRALLSTKTVKTESVPSPKKRFTNQDALDYHQYPEPGKFSILATKPMGN